MVGEVSFASAFGAGLLSFLSPCVLPLVPGYLSYISGVSVHELQRDDASDALPTIVFNSLFFVLGFTIVFTIMGASATVVGQALDQHAVWLSRIGGLLVIVFGLHMLHIVQIPFLNRATQVNLIQETQGPFAAMVLGASFSLGWTPCIGPMLAAILTMASQQQSAQAGMQLLATYSLGLGIPFVLSGLLIITFLGWYKNFRSHLRKIEIASGILLIAVGILLVTNQLTVLGNALQRTFG